MRGAIVAPRHEMTEPEAYQIAVSLICGENLIGLHPSDQSHTASRHYMLPAHKTIGELLLDVACHHPKARTPDEPPSLAWNDSCYIAATDKDSNLFPLPCHMSLEEATSKYGVQQLSWKRPATLALRLVVQDRSM